jgi:hypothetical protein
MSKHHIEWNAAQEKWLCLTCLRTSDHLTREDAERELGEYQCLSVSTELKAAVQERRQSVRKKTGVQAELFLRGRTIPQRVSTSDLSLGGCYIENMFTLPMGAHVTIGLWIGNEKLQIGAKVKTCDPVFGNGIEFVEMLPADREKLEAFLNAVNEP